MKANIFVYFCFVHWCISKCLKTAYHPVDAQWILVEWMSGWYLPGTSSPTLSIICWLNIYPSTSCRQGSVFECSFLQAHIEVLKCCFCFFSFLLWGGSKQRLNSLDLLALIVMFRLKMLNFLSFSYQGKISVIKRQQAIQLLSSVIPNPGPSDRDLLLPVQI